VLYQATFDTVSHTTFTDFGFGFGCDGICSAFSTVRFGSSTGFPALTADFGLDKELHVTYSAPAGQRFVFDPPADAQSADLFSISFLFWLGDVSAIGFDSANATDGNSLDFSGPQGPLAETSFRFIAGHANGWFDGAPIDSFVAEYRANANSPWSFESMSATFTVPAIYDEIFNGFPPEVVLSATARWQWFAFEDPDWTEPDVWGRLEPVANDVPEPATLGLIAAAGAASIYRGRRTRQRSSGNAGGERHS
jgi:hypothetical protein